MSAITKSYFYLILFLLSPLVIAGQNDYDGKWNVDISCSINSNNQMPAFDYKEVWTIQNNAISQTSNKKTKQGDEQTIWSGRISNKVLTINAEGNNDISKKPWLWTGSGPIASSDAFQINAEMIGRIGRKVRDCTLKFSSLDPAIGSLAYLKLNPQKAEQKVELPKTSTGAVKTTQTTPANSVVEINRPNKDIKEPIKSPVTEVERVTPVVQTQPSNIDSISKPTQSGENDYQLYLIAIGAGLIISALVFFLMRGKKDLGSDHSRKLEEELKEKAKANELIAKELERDKERLKKLEQELKEKEISLIKKDELVSTPSQAAQTSIPSSKFCVSCGQSIKFDIKFCPTCGAENKISQKSINDDEKKANRYILKVIASIFFIALIATLIYISTKSNTTSGEQNGSKQSQSSVIKHDGNGAAICSANYLSLAMIYTKYEPSTNKADVALNMAKAFDGTAEQLIGASEAKKIIAQYGRRNFKYLGVGTGVDNFDEFSKYVQPEIEQCDRWWKEVVKN